MEKVSDFDVHRKSLFWENGSKNGFAKMVQKWTPPKSPILRLIFSGFRGPGKNPQFSTFLPLFSKFTLSRPIFDLFCIFPVQIKSQKVEKTVKKGRFWSFLDPPFQTRKKRIFLKKLWKSKTTISRKWSKSGSKTLKNSDFPLFGPLFDPFLGYGFLMICARFPDFISFFSERKRVVF